MTENIIKVSFYVSFLMIIAMQAEILRKNTFIIQGEHLRDGQAQSVVGGKAL